jgi:hypothetical protein
MSPHEIDGPAQWDRTLAGAEFRARKAELEARDGTSWHKLTREEKAAKAARRPIINRF